MKPPYVADLAPDQSVTTFFLVSARETRTGSTGKPYLRVEFADRTGVIESRVWEDSEAFSVPFAAGDIVKVRGRVEVFNGRNQFRVEKLRRAQPDEVDLADYYPHTAEDVEALWTRLRAHVASVANPWLRRLLESVVDDPDIAARFKRAPAAKGMHHAFLGGLLEHVVSLCDLCRIVAPHYPEVDADLLLTGAVLHDVGKIRELAYDRALGYSTEGLLLGHILIAYEMLSARMDAIEGFPPRLKMLVQHMLISHHGRLEFGSPRPPMFREAVLLHYLDDLDSKMAALRASLASAEGEGDWTARNAALERRLLRAEQFLRGDASVVPGAPEQLTLGAPQARDGAAGEGKPED